MDDRRGVIRNRKYANQVYDFSGLRYGNITPTNSDMEIEYHNICWVFAEFKFENTELPFGQKLELERKCDDMQKTKPALGIIASHNTPEGEDINAANATVTQFRFKGVWHDPETITTTKQLVDRFISWVELERIGKRTYGNNRSTE